MDGIEGREKVVIFGATNRPDILDKALIRPGRFDRLIYLPPPDEEARREVFKINISKMSVDSDVIIEGLAECTKVSNNLIRTSLALKLTLYVERQECWR
jgi:SpoVK/Ycf46/Vps4 family AAA+-type ATPase